LASWAEKNLPSGDVERRTSFNWNMDPAAGRALMSMKTIPMTLYSTHVIRRTFFGGTINKELGLNFCENPGRADLSWINGPAEELL
jgi:hypothetical protein